MPKLLESEPAKVEMSVAEANQRQRDWIEEVLNAVRTKDQLKQGGEISGDELANALKTITDGLEQSLAARFKDMYGDAADVMLNRTYRKHASQDEWSRACQDYNVRFGPLYSSDDPRAHYMGEELRIAGQMFHIFNVGPEFTLEQPEQPDKPQI